jgi:AraC-like DNA-binding protein
MPIHSVFGKWKLPSLLMYMTFTFTAGTISHIIMQPFKVLAQPLVPGSHPTCYSLIEGNVLAQTWEMESCALYYFCAGLQKPVTFEIRHEGIAVLLVINLCGKLTFQEYQSGSHTMPHSTGILLLNRNIQGYCTIRFNKQVSRLLFINYYGGNEILNEIPLTQKKQVFVLPASIIELADKILYTSYNVIRPFHSDQVSELIHTAIQSMVNPKRGILVDDSDLAAIHEIKRWIDSHIESDHRLDQLARKVGIHSRKLNQGFQSLFHKTVYEYIREQRLISAHEKIEHSFARLKLIGRAAGYHNYSNFSTAFRTYFGYTPVSLRRK